jgi:outer membrane protein assembly factor BamB
VRRVVLALLGLLVLAGGAAAAWYYHDQTRTHEKRGSSTIEFVTTKPPETVAKRPPKVVHEVPWPMYGYDPQRTHEVGFMVRPPFRKLWARRTGNVIEFPPSLGGGLLFVAQDRGHLLAIDTRNGEVRWRKYLRHCSAASPAVTTDIVYMSYMQPAPCARYPRTQPGFVVAIRYRSKKGMLLKSGQELWRFKTGAVESSPLLVKDTLYVGSWDHHVYAIDISGRRPRLRWRFLADAEVNSSVAYVGGMVFFGTDGGSVYGLNARTGREQWRSTSFSRFGRREYFYATPTVAFGRVYIGNTDGTLYAFGARTGHLLWAQHAGSYVYTAAAIWHRFVIIGTYNGDLIAYDAATGDVRWRHVAPSAIHGAPTVLDNIVYFSTCPVCGSHGSRSSKQGPAGTYGVRASNGTLVWRFGAGRYSPVVADTKQMYVAGFTTVYGFAPRRKGR